MKSKFNRAVVNLRGISCYVVLGGEYLVIIQGFCGPILTCLHLFPLIYSEDVFNLALFHLFHLRQEMTSARRGMSPPCTIHCPSNIVHRSLHSSSQPQLSASSQQEHKAKDDPAAGALHGSYSPGRFRDR
jgi:hypothetical protein